MKIDVSAAAGYNVATALRGPDAGVCVPPESVRILATYESLMEAFQSVGVLAYTSVSYRG